MLGSKQEPGSEKGKAAILYSRKNCFLFLSLPSRGFSTARSHHAKRFIHLRSHLLRGGSSLSPTRLCLSHKGNRLATPLMLIVKNCEKAPGSMLCMSDTCIVLFSLLAARASFCSPVQLRAFGRPHEHLPWCVLCFSVSSRW